VSGNVSLYNETNGRGILPTPSIGGVGLLDDFTKSATLAFKAENEAILLIGDTQGWLGQSVYLRDICGKEEGAAAGRSGNREAQRQCGTRYDHGRHGNRRPRRV
jgi:phosphoribosylformylglycinamidine (FGAM) synthase-like enzyme